MHKEAREELRVRFNLVVVEHANQFGATKTCREFNVPRSTFYRWKHKHDNKGRSGLHGKKPIAHSHPTPERALQIITKILMIHVFPC